MSQRRYEWMEWGASLAIVVIAVGLCGDVRARVLEVDAEMVRRERRLDHVASWSSRGNAEILAQEAVLPPLFPGYRLVERTGVAGPTLVLRSEPEAGR
jgi:hypothetical protein